MHSCFTVCFSSPPSAVLMTSIPTANHKSVSCSWFMQYSYMGTATDKPLMEWLQDYTFPRESGMKNLAAAAAQYKSLVSRLLRNGTTTALYFASLHLMPTLLLARTCAEAGQRAFVGKVGGLLYGRRAQRMALWPGHSCGIVACQSSHFKRSVGLACVSLPDEREGVAGMVGGSSL